MPGDLPFFSICVPTRNRSETLFYCLKTLLHQDFESYEVIVSDNCDTEESKETVRIVQEFNSTKIKYFKPDRFLSMADNYEFALSKASGRYILCIGDDDGMVVDSLKYVYDFIQKYDAKVVKCPRVGYGWPGSLWDANSIMAYPLERPVIQVDSKSILEKVANFELRYSNLPMLYYSFVNREIIDGTIKEKGSFFQNAASIDIYSGFVVAYKTKNFFITDKPFVIMGSSKKSNGGLAMATPDHAIVQEFLSSHNLDDFFKKYKIPNFPRLLLAPVVWLELLKFMENYGLDESFLHVEYRNILIGMISSNPFFNKKDSLGMAEDFKQYSLYDSDIKRLHENFIGKNVYFPNFTNEETEFCQHIIVDPRMFGIKDVYGAAVLSRDFLDSKKTLTPITLPENVSQFYQQPATGKRNFKYFAKRIVQKLLS